MKLSLRLFIFSFLIVFFTCPAVVSGQFLFLPRKSLVGELAPDFTLGTLTHETGNMTEYRKGKKAIIFFWATWCPHCREQLKELNQAKAEIAGKNIQIIVVDIGEKEQVIRRFVERDNIQLEVFLDRDSKVSDSYGVVGVPSFFFVNEAGVVQAIEHYLPERYEEIFSQNY
ncbi:MAG: TlpA disulfide reductase family protein [Candidatus Omnitrophota bacterium]